MRPFFLPGMDDDMPRHSKTLTPAAQAAFVAELAAGALVEAAAAAVGVAISTLYRRRKRDPAFAAAWAAAVAGSGAAVLRRTGKARRMRFDAGRRGRFLAWLEATCNTDWAAAATGVHKSIVYRRIARDGDFARACSEALARGYEALAAELEREDAAKAARADAPIEATGRFTGFRAWAEAAGAVGAAGGAWQWRAGVVAAARAAAAGGVARGDREEARRDRDPGQGGG